MNFKLYYEQRSINPCKIHEMAIMASQKVLFLISVISQIAVKISVLSVTKFRFDCQLKEETLPYFEKWKNSEFRTTIKHLYFKGLTTKEIKTETHKADVCVFANVYSWINEFKNGRTSADDKNRSERPMEVNILEKIEKLSRSTNQSEIVETKMHCSRAYVLH